ncbi:MAG: ATP-binding cassette domain-containing protein [Mesorhizobium sp.]|uniref:ABC transporter ATP-binding protein n=1 Tax=Mesorhizobium sp. M6A.T.Cr.TU.016.01.1.1 TaxID=2493677 RepID=UPI000F75CFE2|nr:ABC transporter ATP-binding protein [Mesorhizobium sp. M6A.T.Cr.TU.016.01.1.1]AZO63871.1 ABC transporter ATP-binding protein [Mesorhizobium sp. M6A.T.Cr.TU.016.01.1.1]RWQ85693.1 MAG: ATP-binding cassette domain-containing protein [Mesorhizobium sp.]
MSSDGSGIEAGGRGTDIAIRVRDVSKHYVMFERPEDRFKQMVVPRLERLMGRPPRRYYRDFAALSGISFEVGRGETVGIIGRNGSGKSTLLQIVCGTLQPTSGSVEVNGRVAALLELGAGFNPEFTGRENVFLNASILGVPHKEMEWRFDDIARFADIGPFIDQPVRTYSSGMYVRLAFATAINVDPDILVVDEALAVGDEAFQRKCFTRIEQIKDRGGTILFVSHGASTIVQLCTRAMLIDAGEKIFEGPSKAVVNQYQRLVNASTQAAGEVRAAIVGMPDLNPAQTGILVQQTTPAADGDEITTDSLPNSGQEAGPSLPQIQDQVQMVKYAEHFDPTLVSQSVIHLEERGARIRDIRILTFAGERVNTLQLGKRYVFEYFVDFSAEANNVGFGMFIKLLNGVGLGGANSNRTPGSQLRSVSKTTTRHVRFEFDCRFLPGTYVANCEVTGTVAGETYTMHRVVDAELFRVSPEPDLLAIGYLNLEPMLTVSYEDDVAERTQKNAGTSFD